MIETDRVVVKLVIVLECTNLNCHDDADIVVAMGIALCGPHALEWYQQERVR